MSDVKIATRESYGNALVELGASNPDVVVLDADLAGATKTGTFKKAYPDRFIDCGLAMATLACMLYRRFMSKNRWPEKEEIILSGCSSSGDLNTPAR